METGKITKLNKDHAYGFVTTKSKQEIFFSSKSQLDGMSLDQLVENQDVEVLVEETPRGLFAKELKLVKPRPRSTSSSHLK